MLLLLLPLLNSSSLKNLLRPFSKDKSSSSAEATPTIPFVALPCQHSYMYYNFLLTDTVITVFGLDALLLHHLGVLVAVSRLSLCKGMAVSPQNDSH
ncbi:hypothetical protein Lal_00021809 [Lupinus albus]|nr:hypothetical protein Lal_00021809 [Lupinus albus]